VPVIPLDGQTLRDAAALMERVASSSGARCLVFLTRPAVADSNDGLGELLAQLRNALEVCRVCALELVFLSGHQVFAGYPGSQLHPDEEFPSRPAGAIGEALYLGELLIELHVERDGLEALIVRACATYGPGDSRPSFLRTFVSQAVRGEEITTHRYRNGVPVVELLHVRDFAAGMALAVRKHLTGRLHLGSGQGITTPALAQTIARLAGSTSSVRSVDLPGEPASIVLDCSRALAALGWVASIALEGGLSELLADTRPLDLTNRATKS
jgi:nucleoside-diphosphate-sugar epimerase